MDKVRLGIIGMGTMGSYYASVVRDGKIDRCELTAVCEADQSKLCKFPGTQGFTECEAMIDANLIDALLIATPHYFHTTAGIAALNAGLHVLVEKPISVHKADCERLIAAHKNPEQVFAAVFQFRTFYTFKKIKQLIDEGHLGEIVRVNWIVTDWFRSEAYYASGGWRATWKGEGGGVLLNQCPHNLDLLCWYLGMPSRVRGYCGFGARHNIEVEDQVTAYLEYPNGATGVFIASTGEHPGTNRLEIIGDGGKLVYENAKLTFIRNEIPTSEFSRTTDQSFGRPDTWHVEFPGKPQDSERSLIIQNFVDAILDGTPLAAPAEEGMMSVELANAIVYSSIKDQMIELPLDGAAYEKELDRLIAESEFKKKVVKPKKVDIEDSFHKG